MFFVGVDLSDKHFDFCITDPSGSVLSRGKPDFNDEGFLGFLNQLHKHGLHGQDCLIGLENPRSRLVDFLIARGFSVLLTNSNAIAKYRESRAPSKAKSDAGDAHLIADYIREHHKVLQVIQIPDATIRELKFLLEDRDRLIQQKVRFSNQLTSALKDCFPDVLEAFGDIASKTALKFLKQFDSLQQAQTLSVQEAEHFLNQCYCYNRITRERFFRMLKQKPAAIPPEVIRAKARLKQALVEHLLLLLEQIKDYDQQIQQMVDSTPHGELFRSLPGADYLLGAKLLVLYCSREFQRASEVQSFCGTVPYTTRSGQFHSVQFRLGCHKFGRKTFQQLAYSSLGNSAWAKKQFRRKLQEGKHIHHAIRCVANLWVKITFAMWRDKKPYEEQKHLASIASHLLNQPVFTEGG